jgi:hypothetical protein
VCFESAGKGALENKGNVSPQSAAFALFSLSLVLVGLGPSPLSQHESQLHSCQPKIALRFVSACVFLAAEQ